MRSTRAIHLALPALTLAFPIASAQMERQTLSGERVAIYNLAGKLRIEGGSGSDVVVEITRGGKDASQLKVANSVVNGQQSLRVIYPSDRIVYPELDRWNRTTVSVADDGTWGDNEDRGSRSRGRDRVEIRGSGSGLEAFADLRVIIPRGKRVVVHHAVGDARASNVDADLMIDVASADIVVEHMKGHLSLGTGSGSLTVTDATGDVDLDTGSGGVTVNGVKGEVLRMDTGSGSIRGSDIDVSDLKADVGSGGVRLSRVKATRVDVDAGSGGTEIELLSAVETLKVDAGSGGVTVRLPATLSAEVDLETGSGGIDTDFPMQITHFERRHMVGKIGDGRGRIRIESGSGRVRLIKS